MKRTLGFGLNVQLVFRSALNIVQLFTAAAVVTVVQHCSSPILPKTGCWAKILLAPPLAALNSNLEYRFHKFLSSFEEIFSVYVSLDKPKPAKFGSK